MAGCDLDMLQLPRIRDRETRAPYAAFSTYFTTDRSSTGVGTEAIDRFIEFHRRRRLR